MQNVSEKLAGCLISKGIGTGDFYLDEDAKGIYISLFQFAHPFYPKEFEELDNDFTEAKALPFIDQMMKDCFRKVFPILEVFKSQFPLIFQNVFEMLKTGEMSSFEDFEKLQPSMLSFQEEILNAKREKSGISAKSLEDLIEQESLAECKKNLMAMPDDFEVEQFLAASLKDAYIHILFRLLRDAVRNSPKSSQDSKILLIFDRLIANYISPSPAKIWRTYPDFNFSYSIPNLEIIEDSSMPLDECHYMVQRMEIAAREILPALEYVLIGFEQTKNYKDILKKNLFWIFFCDPNKIMDFARTSGIKKWPSDPSSVAALSGFLKSIIIKINDLYSKDSKESRLLGDVLAFLPWNVKMFLILNQFTNLEDVDCHIDEMQNILLDQAHIIYDTSFDDTWEKASFLIEAKTKKLKDIPILGIGFSGPKFEPRPIEKIDSIYLNFTQKFRSNDKKVSGIPILHAISILLANDRICILDPSENDNDTFTYITHKVLDLINQNQKEIHPVLRKVFREALLDRVNSELVALNNQFKKPIKAKQPKQIQAEEKKKTDLKQEILEAECVVSKIKKEEFDELTGIEIALLKKLIDNGAFRICVETVITQFSGNPYTLAFAMGDGVGSPVLLEGKPYELGGRILIQPCLTRCQILGIAHTLLGDLKHLPSLQQAHERMQVRGGEGIQPMDSKKVNHTIQEFLQDVCTAMDKFQEISDRKLISKSKAVSSIKGIQNSNFGNDCFMNSVLQLIHYSHLKDFFMNHSDIGERNNVLVAIKNFLQNLGNGEKILPTTSHFRNLLGFNEDEQNDPVEFLTQLLNLCDTSSISVQMKGIIKVPLHNLRPSNKKDGIKINQDGLGEKMAPMPFIPLAFPEGNEEITFQNLLSSYLNPLTTSEEATFSYQESIYESVYTESWTFDSSPDHLLVQLKRFEFSLENKDYKKILMPVEIQFQEVLQNVAYELKSFIIHCGDSARAGHYISFIKFEHGWQKFNDAEVSFVDNHEALKESQNSYLLYFVKNQPFQMG